MRTLQDYIIESSTKVVNNYKFNKLLKQNGLEKIQLCKGNGYFWLTSEDDETYRILSSLETTSIYTNSFSDQTPEEWVEEIKELLKDTELVQNK
jgi:hypothetical protein